MLLKFIPTAWLQSCNNKTTCNCLALQASFLASVAMHDLGICIRSVPLRIGPGKYSRTAPTNIAGQSQQSPQGGFPELSMVHQIAAEGKHPGALQNSSENVQRGMPRRIAELIRNAMHANLTRIVEQLLQVLQNSIDNHCTKAPRGSGGQCTYSLQGDSSKHCREEPKRPTVYLSGAQQSRRQNATDQILKALGRAP